MNNTMNNKMNNKLYEDNYSKIVEPKYGTKRDNLYLN